MSKVLPILFNTEMVRAILDGRKAVTRRVIKEEQYLPVLCSPARKRNPEIPDKNFIERLIRIPCEVGDILYVRETWRMRNVYGDFTRGGRFAEIEFRAGGDFSHMSILKDVLYGNAWHPSIHMPKEAARIWLKVTDVRVERLQDMTLDDCHKEGINIATEAVTDGETVVSHHDWSLERFETLWDSTVKKSDIASYGWDANPWVWVIEFERCRKPESDMDPVRE